MLYPLEAAGFGQWLVAQTGEVGVAHCACDCPLARYLQAVSGQEYAVTQYYYAANALREYGWLPEWAKRFVCLLDALYDGQEAVSQALAVYVFAQCVTAS